MNSVTLWLAMLLMQDARGQTDRVRAAMAASLAQQRASVRRQTGGGSVASFRPSSGVCETVSKPELARLIDETAGRQGIDPALVREVIRQESGFQPCAVSVKGAEGLMQLMPATQAQFQVRNPFNAQQSIEGGSKLLKQLLDRYHGDLSLALGAYNAGPGRVDKTGGVPAIPETTNYIAEILKRLAQQNVGSEAFQLPPAVKPQQ